MASGKSMPEGRGERQRGVILRIATKGSTGGKVRTHGVDVFSGQDPKATGGMACIEPGKTAAK
jgi:hypothetical protein